MPSFPMLSLPLLNFDSVQWHLPLCDATAMELAQVFIENDRSQRIVRFARLLEVDPALGIWARLCAALHYGDKQLPVLDRIPPLAEWLAGDGTYRCDWQTIKLVDFSAEQQSAFASLVAESVSNAREATRGFPHDFAVLQPLYLGVLATHWRTWLQVANPLQTPPEPWGAMAKLPDKIVGGLTPSTEARQTADEAWRRWLSEISGVRSLLPQVIAQSLRFQELEIKFADSLHTAKLEAMKEFAYGAGHELNNPLANIASRAQTLLTQEKDPERRRRLAAINTQAFRAHEMLADMMLFARPPKPQFEQVDVIQLVDGVLAELANDAIAQETTLQRVGDCGPCTIDADPTQLRVALRALCLNSLEALGRGGNVVVEVRSAECGMRNLEATLQSELRVPNFIDIIVSDTGPGISSDIREKIFDPFFSGREAGRGLGFGLSKCWRIVTLHGGKIEVESEPPSGAKFVITLPTNRLRA